MRKMLRDEKGHFTGAEMDPKIQRMIDEEQRRAAGILKVCETFGLKPETLGLKQFPETGLWHIGYQTKFMMEGMGFGIALASRKGMPKKEVAAALLPLCEAMGITDIIADLKETAQAAA